VLREEQGVSSQKPAPEIPSSTKEWEYGTVMLKFEKTSILLLSIIVCGLILGGFVILGLFDFKIPLGLEIFGITPFDTGFIVALMLGIFFVIFAYVGINSFIHRNEKLLFTEQGIKEGNVRKGEITKRISKDQIKNIYFGVGWGIGRDEKDRELIEKGWKYNKYHVTFVPYIYWKVKKLIVDLKGTSVKVEFDLEQYSEFKVVEISNGEEKEKIERDQISQEKTKDEILSIFNPLKENCSNFYGIEPELQVLYSSDIPDFPRRKPNFNGSNEDLIQFWANWLSKN
jgi:hypothetical protein